MTDICHQCNEEFKVVGGHWSRSDCQHPSISERKHEILTGLLMGDGNLSRKGKNAYFRCNMITRPFLEWLDEEFGVMGLGVKLQTTAAETARRMNENGFSTNTKAENCHDLYGWNTRAHPDFNRYREWYTDDGKAFPDHLELTPLIAKVWYCCDGCVHGCYNGNDYRPHIQFSVTSQIEREDLLVRMFEDVGFDVSLSGENLYAIADESERIWEWLGEPLPGFEYKWPEAYQ